MSSPGVPRLPWSLEDARGSNNKKPETTSNPVAGTPGPSFAEPDQASETAESHACRYGSEMGGEGVVLGGSEVGLALGDGGMGEESSSRLPEKNPPVNERGFFDAEEIPAAFNEDVFTWEEEGREDAAEGDAGGEDEGGKEIIAEGSSPRIEGGPMARTEEGGAVEKGGAKPFEEDGGLPATEGGENLSVSVGQEAGDLQEQADFGVASLTSSASSQPGISGLGGSYVDLAAEPRREATVPLAEDADRPAGVFSFGSARTDGGTGDEGFTEPQPSGSVSYFSPEVQDSSGSQPVPSKQVDMASGHEESPSPGASGNFGFRLGVSQPSKRASGGAAFNPSKWFRGGSQRESGDTSSGAGSSSGTRNSGSGLPHASSSPTFSRWGASASNNAGERSQDARGRAGHGFFSKTSEKRTGALPADQPGRRLRMEAQVGQGPRGDTWFGALETFGRFREEVAVKVLRHSELGPAAWGVLRGLSYAADGTVAAEGGPGFEGIAEGASPRILPGSVWVVVPVPEYPISSWDQAPAPHGLAGSPACGDPMGRDCMQMSSADTRADVGIARQAIRRLHALMHQATACQEALGPRQLELISFGPFVGLVSARARCSIQETILGRRPTGDKGSGGMRMGDVLSCCAEVAHYLQLLHSAGGLALHLTPSNILLHPAPFKEPHSSALPQHRGSPSVPQRANAQVALGCFGLPFALAGEPWYDPFDDSPGQRGTGQASLGQPTTVQTGGPHLHEAPAEGSGAGASGRSAGENAASSTVVSGIAEGDRAPAVDTHPRPRASPAKLLRGLFGGDPQYAAPEQWAPGLRGPLCRGTDSWAFACCAIAMATGLKPWSGMPTARGIHDALLVHYRQPYDAHEQQEILKQTIPPGLLTMLLACFHPDPLHRPTPLALLRALYRPLTAVHPGDWVCVPSRSNPFTRIRTVCDRTLWDMCGPRQHGASPGSASRPVCMGVVTSIHGADNGATQVQFCSQSPGDTVWFSTRAIVSRPMGSQDGVREGSTVRLCSGVKYARFGWPTSSRVAQVIAVDTRSAVLWLRATVQQPQGSNASASTSSSSSTSSDAQEQGAESTGGQPGQHGEGSTQPGVAGASDHAPLSGSGSDGAQSDHSVNARMTSSTESSSSSVKSPGPWKADPGEVEPCTAGGWAQGDWACLTLEVPASMAKVAPCPAPGSAPGLIKTQTYGIVQEIARETLSIAVPGLEVLLTGISPTVNMDAFEAPGREVSAQPKGPIAAETPQPSSASSTATPSPSRLALSLSSVGSASGSTGSSLGTDTPRSRMPRADPAALFSEVVVLGVHPAPRQPFLYVGQMVQPRAGAKQPMYGWPEAPDHEGKVQLEAGGEGLHEGPSNKKSGPESSGSTPEGGDPKDGERKEVAGGDGSPLPVGRIDSIAPNGMLLVSFPGIRESHGTSWHAHPADVELVSWSQAKTFREKWKFLGHLHWLVQPAIAAAGVFLLGSIGVPLVGSLLFQCNRGVKEDDMDDTSPKKTRGAEQKDLERKGRKGGIEHLREDDNGLAVLFSSFKKMLGIHGGEEDNVF